jgi:hypothetical protein
MPDGLTNRFLFSHHYLERICQEASDRTEAAQLIADLRGWASGWDDRSLSSLINTQIYPTLVSLGFDYDQTSDGGNPHLLRLYATYRHENLVGLCYVAHRQDEAADLDCTIKGRHYAAEIVHALQEEGLDWGLLTDGIRWRLYHAAGPTPYETFLEIDLDPLLRGEPGVEDAAYLFHLLFTEPAFEADKDDECALDRHLSASEGEASSIEKHLSNCIEDVLRDLCQGFVERDGQEAYTSDERDEVFHDATVLLYRLLFILYAEARDLLPLEEPEYHSASLDALVERAAREVKVTGLADPDGTQLWRDLSDLCSWINSGDADHHIPAYNGNLFDDSDKRYIHDHTIADKYLAPALFSLGAIEEGTEARFRRIDYRDLSVRHLGSIYEGLLEYKLFIAQERRVRRADGKGGYTFPKLSETRLKKGEEDEVIGVGDVYFAHSAGERKAMGAYYTPEYIVDYIVKQTVRRGLEERREPLDRQLPGWLEEVTTAPPAERPRLQKTVDQWLLDFVEQEVLTFRLCDPAMGSGHFLVNAVHNITNFIVETLNLTPWENPAIDSDPAVWRRRVAKQCLYGVDLNELAVELAKLSLWLTTAEKGRPLSFLDHHLRPGNSLIGARLEDLIKVLDQRTPQEKKRQATGQTSMFDEYPGFRAPLQEASDLVRKISARVADVAEDIKSQAADYERVRRALKPYRDLADLITAQHFGVDIDGDQLRIIAQHLLENKSELPEKHQELLSEASELARRRSFFHWDMEFPEAFVNERGAQRKGGFGFDAVVGNPPYIAYYSRYAEEIDPSLREYLEGKFSGTVTRALNTFLLFLVQGLRIAVIDGYSAMIVPDTFCVNERYEPTRRFVYENAEPLKIALLRFPVFGDPTVRSVVPLAKKGMGTEECVMLAFASPKAVSARDSSNEWRLSKKYLESRPGFTFPLRPYGAGLEQKIRDMGVPLAEFCKVRDGINPGPRSFKSQIVFKEKASGGSFLNPLLVGSDIQRYTISEPDLWVDYNPALLTPELKKQGASLREKWIFTSKKLVSRQTSDRLIFALDEAQYFVLNSVHCTVKKPKTAEGISYVLTILNSRLMQWYYVAAYQETRDVFPQVHISALRELPIRRIEFGSSQTGREHMVEAQRLCERSLLSNPQSAEKPTRLLSLIDEYMETCPVQEGVVHDVLIHLAEQMIEFHKQRQELERQVDLFHYVDAGQSFIRLKEAFVLDESRRVDDVMDLQTVHHDIDDLRLVPNPDGTWTLELQAKFRDPEEGWQEWIKEEDGYSIKRRWVPAYRLPLDEEKARFYRYALPRLQDFDNARSFPGGYTRTTLQKLHATKVPMMPDVDLRELARLDQELSETRRKIARTDDLIDQIVYKLYDLTEEEIAIIEGQAP